MMFEIAEYHIPPNRSSDFEAATDELKTVIGSSPGYSGHTIQRSLETPERCVLLVRWTSLEMHETVFAGQSRFKLERRGSDRAAPSRSMTISKRSSSTIGRLARSPLPTERGLTPG